MPELLTVFFSSVQGLFGASLYNIISSNVINFIQYICAIKINKNSYVIRKNRALKIELGIVVVTIIIPILMTALEIDANITVVPIFVLLFIMLYFVKQNAYKVYKINSMSESQEKEIEEEKRWVKNKKKIAINTCFKLLGVGIILFVIGNLLGNTLESFSYNFNIPEWVIGIILGFVTSIPELITFIEAQKHHGKETSDEHGVIEATSNLFASNMLNLFVIESIGIVTYVIVMSF